MRVSSLLILAATFLGAAALSLFAAQFAVRTVEESSYYGVTTALEERKLTWTEVSTDGLQVVLKGTAPSEASRFIAVSTAGTVVDAARVIDQMEVESVAALAPPRFSIEILRNEDKISLIGLIPTKADRETLLKRLEKLAGDDRIADLLESADYPLPEGWDDAVAFGIDALESLPRSKVSIDARRVEITAMTDSEEQKTSVESRLARNVPDSLDVAFKISAPRPVITPFSLRFIKDENGARFDSCSADNEEARARITGAAAQAGIEGKTDCEIGLGVPSPNWSEAAAQSIAAVATLGGGTVTFSDADITLIAAEGTPQGIFDKTIGQLENSLPEVFALHAVLPKPPSADEEGPAEFTVTLSPEGQVHMQGRLNDEAVSATAESFATARFGSEKVRNTARTDETLSPAWPARVLTGLEALSQLANGAVRVTADEVSVTGNTGSQNARAEITKLFSERLGETGRFAVNVTYQKKLDPKASMKGPKACEAAIGEILAKSQIKFEPGSATVDAASLGTVDDIAATLKKCYDTVMEIAGHTDSQGREAMNEELSKSRAQAVLNALRERRANTVGFRAVGYGESQPIAGNDTEAGREANRRIEFKLINESTNDSALESPAASEASGGAEAATE